MAKEHVENLAAPAVAPIAWNPPGLPPGAQLRPLARDADSGGFTGLIDLPGGFDSGSALRCAAPMRLFVIEGALLMGEHRLGPGGFCFHPAGSVQGRWRVPQGTRVFTVFLAEPDFRAHQRDSEKAAPGAVPALDSWVMDWHNPLDASAPSEDFRPGIFVKVLHIDPETQASTHLAGLMPGWYAEGMEQHPVYEENYCLQGDVCIGEVGDGPGYTMTAGSYLCRPPGIIHGPLASKNGNVNLCFTHGLLGIEYSANPRAMDIIRRHLATHPWA
ncbi:DUF4437 domain-containing protein [Candidatus Foliamicus sp.]